MTDTNVTIGVWPFRHLPFADPVRFLDKCQQGGVSKAWAASFDALFHEDVASVNDRLVELCRAHGQSVLLPVGCVNPTLPDWEEDLRRCAETHRMHAIRLLPNYHGYSLSDAFVLPLLERAAMRKLIVQIVVSMEDARTQHPLVRVSPVDLKPLAALLDQLPDIRVQILNGGSPLPVESLRPFVKSGRVWFDIATVEAVGGVAKLIEMVGVERVCFGSHFPLFHLESAVLKVKEADLKEPDRLAVLSRNAASMEYPK